MAHSTAERQKRQMDLVRTQFAQKQGLAFAEVLPAERVEQALQQELVSWRDCVLYTVADTVGVLEPGD
jgi:hypothetical protein